MNQPRLTLTLDGLSGSYRPGELLSGQFSLDDDVADEVRAVELSVLWHTEGKGDEDMAVHFFERIEPDEDLVIDFRRPRRFSTVLPNSPLSYTGLILRICWCVRVRMFLRHGREWTQEVPFQLGAVPSPEPAAV